MAKAKITEFQKGLDAFLKNDFWGEVYESAPDGAKMQLERQFWGSDIMFQNNRTLNDEEEALSKRMWEEKIRPALKKGDWEYLAKFSRDSRQKKWYKEQAEKSRT